MFRFMRCAGFVLWVACTANVVADPLQVGAAAVKITPPLGASMAGYYHGRGADAVHDDLYAKAIVLEQGKVKAALVSLDLISTSREMVDRARQLIGEQTGVPLENVMISATHTHTGPDLHRRSSPAPSTGRDEDPLRKYLDQLPEKIARCVGKAEAALAAARGYAATGHEPSLAFNRRFHMNDGTVGWNPGKRNPSIVKPAGPIDPDVSVVYFQRAGRKPLACYVNYAVHLDNVGGTQISADLPYTLSQCLAQVKGQDFLTFYTTGCCGDVNHIDVNWSEPQKGHDNAARMGIVLAGDVLRSLPRLKPVDGPLRARHAMVKLPLPEVTAEQIATARQVVARPGRQDATRRSFMETVQARKVLDVAHRAGRPWEVEVQVITLGNDVAWVSLPGEVFVELGLALKQDSPFPQTIVAELANGSIGYIPSRRAYPQGNYEVVSARCAEGSGELLVRAAVRMLTDIYTQNVQSRDK